jgi:alpha-1,3-rhamnosyl/mannosyltransferase
VLTGGRLDGMGVYSHALLEHLPHAGVECCRFRSRRPATPKA